MRTTVTLDPDTFALLQRSMDERGISFKEALNRAVRDGLTGRAQRAVGEGSPTPTFAMGQPLVGLDHALRLAGELEDAEIARELERRK